MPGETILKIVTRVENYEITKRLSELSGTEPVRMCHISRISFVGLYKVTELTNCLRMTRFYARFGLLGFHLELKLKIYSSPNVLFFFFLGNISAGILTRIIYVSWC